MIATGIFLAGLAPEESPGAEDESHTTQAWLYAIGAAVAIGWSLYAIGRISIALPVVWALLPSG